MTILQECEEGVAKERGIENEDLMGLWVGVGIQNKSEPANLIRTEWNQ